MTLIFCLSKIQNIFQLNSYRDHTSVYKMLLYLKLLFGTPMGEDLSC